MRDRIHASARRSLPPPGWFTDVVFLTSSGDKVLIQEVLFDAVVTAPLEAYWTSLVLNKSEFVYIWGRLPCTFRVRCSVGVQPCGCVFVKPHRNSDKGVEIAYLGTRTGLSRINLFVVPDELTNQ